MLGSLGEVHGRRLGFLGRARYLHGSLVDGGYQFTQLVDGVVDRVGDRTGEILGYGGGYRQVTVSEVADLVQQSQNRCGYVRSSRRFRSGGDVPPEPSPGR